MEGNLNNDNNSGSTSRRPTTSIDSRGSAMNNSGMEVDPNWRISFPENSRVKIIDKIISTLQGQLSVNPKEAINTKDMNRLKNMAYTVEANIHSAANSKEDYMRKIKATLKSIEVKRPGRVMNSLPDNSTGFDQKLLDSGTSFMQPSQVQARPQLLYENIQSSITECSAGFASALSTMPGLSQAGISTLGAQTTGMSNMSGISKNSLNNSTAQVLPQNTLTKSPRYEMQAEQPRQQQKQTQTQHHSIYQQQLQNLQQLSHLQHSVPQQLQPQQSFLKQKQHRQLPAHVQPAQQQHSSTSIDLSGQSEQRTIGAEDQLEMIYQKLQSLKETYLPNIKEAKNFLIEISRKPLRPDQLGKVNQFLKKLRQIEACLHATKGGLPQGFDEDKISQLEKHIILFLNGLGTPKPAALQHEEQLQLQSSSRAQSVQLDKNKNVIQQQKQTLVQMQDHHQHLVQAKQLKELQPGQQQHPLFQQQQQKMQHSSFQQSQQVQHPSLQPQQQQMQHDSFQQPQQMQHPSLQQQQQQMQHDSFQQPQQVQHPSLWPQQQQMHHSSFQLPQQVQHPSLQPQQQQMQHDSFQQPQQMHHSSFQLPQQVQHPSLQPQQQQMQHDSFQQPQQMQHPSLQQQMQHDSFQRPQQVQHPSLRPQQQQMQHSSFQLPQQVQHPSFQMQDSRFQQQEQVQHPLLQQQQQQTMQHQQKKHQVAQRAQINKQQTARVQPRSDISSQVKAKSTGAFKPSSVQQRQLGQLSNYQQQPQEQQHQQFYQSSSLSASSSHLLEVSSPEISQHFTPQIDKQSLKTSPPEFLKIENPIQPATSSCVASSHSTLPTPSTLLENIDAKSASVVCSVSVTRSGQGLQQSVTTSANTQSLTVTTSADTQSLTIGTPGISASPLLGTSSPNIAQNPVSQDGSQTMSRGLIMGEKKTTERPIDRLVKMIHSMSPESFKTAASDIGALANLSDSMAGSALARRSKAAVGEDLVDMTRFHLQENNLMSLDSGAPAKKMRRCMSSLPVIIASSDGSLDYSPHCITDFESSKMLSTGMVTAKSPRLELERVLQPEIQNVNEQLFETVVDVSDNDIDAASCEGRDGIVVKCSYNPLSWGRKTDSGDKHADKSPISPLWLLIPLSYPKCSPVVLNRPPVETIKEYEGLFSKAKAMFDVSVRNLPEPMTLETLARTWDKCARNVVAQYVYERGGDNFNAQCGPWEYCTSD